MTWRRDKVVLQGVLVLLVFGAVLAKRCPTSKNMMLLQNIKVNFHMNSNHHAPSMQDETRMRSLSPWNYSLNEDPNRFPAIIAEAKCNHGGCLDSDGKEDLSVVSVPIKQEVLVLRRHVEECESSFTLDKQMVTVGCTCIWHQTQAATRGLERESVSQMK
ncbi:interleukin-17A-like [Spea bombifrons]|uniref:interleukin-17A-like n=1 Tax=Spea bombifrons TaxID=233779 RepID=UPI00234ACCB5|nr:interleukin-17A-like [Spea bombifrons]